MCLVGSVTTVTRTLMQNSRVLGVVSLTVYEEAANSIVKGSLKIASEIIYG